MRYLGRPFMILLESRWKNCVPDLDVAAGSASSAPRRHIVHFEGAAEEQFRSIAAQVVAGEIPVGPSLDIRAPYFHRVTNRLVAQMTSCTAMIEYFDDSFDVATTILLRHPISNALSIERENWDPECFEFLEHSWYRDTFLTGEQVDSARAIEQKGSLRERHVLDWCLKMLPPIRAFDSGHHPDWLMVSYEHAVLDPAHAVSRISVALDLPDQEPILAQMARPSRTVTASTASKVNDPAYLVSRWRDRVKPGEERQLMDILELFEIDAYELGRDEPVERFGG